MLNVNKECTKRKKKKKDNKGLRKRIFFLCCLVHFIVCLVPQVVCKFVHLGRMGRVALSERQNRIPSLPMAQSGFLLKDFGLSTSYGLVYGTTEWDSVFAPGPGLRQSSLYRYMPLSATVCDESYAL